MNKKRYQLAIALAIAVSALAVPAAATAEAFKSGNNLMEFSRAGTAVGRNMLLHYVAGAHDVMDGTYFCTPTNATLGQVTDVVVKFLETNPELRNEAGSHVIAFALRATWPCPKK